MSKFNYVYLPISIGVNDGYHLTVKFLGELEISPAEVAQRLKETLVRYVPTLLEWKPEVFDNGVTVMEITKFDPVLRSMNEIFKDFRKDDYPVYRPHITIKDKALWEMLKRRERKIFSVDVRIGFPFYAYKGQHFNLLEIMEEL